MSLRLLCADAEIVDDDDDDDDDACECVGR